VHVHPASIAPCLSSALQTSLSHPCMAQNAQGRLPNPCANLSTSLQSTSASATDTKNNPATSSGRGAPHLNKQIFLIAMTTSMQMSSQGSSIATPYRNAPPRIELQQSPVDEVHNAEGLIDLVAENLAWLYTGYRQSLRYGERRRCGELLWRLCCVRVPQHCSQRLAARHCMHHYRQTLQVRSTSYSPQDTCMLLHSLRGPASLLGTL
jgi:hypothetical protein